MNANVFNIIVYDELPNATRLAMRAMRMRIGYMSMGSYLFLKFKKPPFRGHRCTALVFFGGRSFWSTLFLAAEFSCI